MGGMLIISGNFPDFMEGVAWVMKLHSFIVIG